MGRLHPTGESVKRRAFNYSNRMDIRAIGACLFSLIMIFAVRLCRLVVPKVF